MSVPSSINELTCIIVSSYEDNTGIISDKLTYSNFAAFILFNLLYNYLCWSNESVLCIIFTLFIKILYKKDDTLKMWHLSRYFYVNNIK